MGEGPALTGAAPATAAAAADTSAKPGKDEHAHKDHAALKKNAMKAVKMAYRWEERSAQGYGGRSKVSKNKGTERGALSTAVPTYAISVCFFFQEAGVGAR